MFYHSIRSKSLCSNTANVTIGDATLPGYAIKPTKAGILDFDQNGTSIARLEIDGNVEAVGLQLRASAAERVMISGGANTIAASTYPGAWVGDATGLISGRGRRCTTCWGL